MFSKINKHILNWTLLGVLSVLFVAPFWVGGYLVIKPEVSGRVAGAQISLDFELYPNLIDFNDYVSFQPQKAQAGLFFDQLRLTAFSGQQATYHNLYEIYNPNKKPIYIKATLANAPQGFSARQKALLVLSQPNVELSTKLSAPASIGATLLTLNNPQAIGPLSKKIIAQDTLLDVLNISDNQIVTVPLKQPLGYEVDLHPEAIFVNGLETSWPQTQWVVVGPGQRASLTAIVYGNTRSSQPAADTQVLSLPLRFESSFSPTPQ